MPFSYYRSVTVDHTLVPSTQTDFPLLVSFTHDDLRTVGNGGNVQHSSAYDVGFFSDAGLSSALFWEMEEYDPTTGKVVAWVKISSLSSSVDTVIYVGYGDSSISSFQSTVSSVWDSDYEGVWHFKSGFTSALSTTDSTTNNNALASAGSYTSASGQINGGASQGGSSYMNLGSNKPLDGLTAFTLEAYLYNQNGGSAKAFMSDWTSRQLLWRNETTNQLRLLVEWTDATSDTSGYSPSGYAANVWTKVVATYDGTTLRTYSNAVAGPTVSVSGKTIKTSASTTNFGGGPVGSEDYWVGGLDEFRISRIARSANWISAEYANQNSPGTFFALGSEQVIASGQPALRRMATVPFLGGSRARAF